MHDNMNYPNLVTGPLTESDLDAHLNALGTSRMRACVAMESAIVDADSRRRKHPYHAMGLDGQGRRPDRAYVPTDGQHPDGAHAVSEVAAEALGTSRQWRADVGAERQRPAPWRRPRDGLLGAAVLVGSALAVLSGLWALFSWAAKL